MISQEQRSIIQCLHIWDEALAVITTRDLQAHEVQPTVIASINEILPSCQQIDSLLVVTLHCIQLLCIKLDEGKEAFNPTQLLSCVADSKLFSFSGGCGDCLLFARFPFNKSTE